jgi:tetratricopeptide (TPR) repeat protein
MKQEDEQSLKPADDIASILQRGEARLLRADYAGAIEDFNHVVQLQPDHAKAYFLRGKAKLGLNFTNYAFSDFNEAIRLKPDYLEAYRSRAALQVYYAVGDVDLAFDDLDRAIEGGFEVAASYADRGFSRYYQGELVASVEDCDRAIELAGPTAGFLFNRGLARLGLGEWEGELNDFDGDLALRKNDPTSYSYRGLVRLLTGDRESAERDFEEYLRLNPDKRQTIEQNRRLAGLLLAEPQPETADQFADRAQLLLKSGFQNECVADCSRAILIDERHARALETRGDTLLALKYVSSAIRDYDLASASQPRNAELYYKRGVARQNKLQMELAIADFDQCIKLEPRHFTAMNVRGNVLFDSGRFAEAELAYAQCVATSSPPNYVYLENLGVALLENGKASQALDALNRAIDAGGDPETYARRGAVFVALGDRDSATKDLAKAKELGPTNLMVAELEARIWLAVGDAEQATSAADRVLKITPYYSEGYRLRALAQEIKGQMPAAIADLDEAISWHAEAHGAFLSRGLMRRKNGDETGANTDFENARRLAPYKSAFFESVIAYDQSKSVAEAMLMVVRLAAQSAESGAHAKSTTTQGAKAPKAAQKSFDAALEFYNQGEWESANKEFKKSIALFPKYAEAYMYRGLIHLQKGETADAERMFAESIRLQPDLKTKIASEREKIK